MNNIIKYWDDNLVSKHIGTEINWLFSYLDNENIKELKYIDIGSNVGKFFDVINEKYIIKQSIMIEPSKTLFEFLNEKFKDKDNIMLHNFAISDTNSYLWFDDLVSNAIDYYEKIGINDSINLGLSKLNRNMNGNTLCYSMDFFLRNICTIPPNDIDFIKIDTENSDLFIIKNMTDFIKEHEIKPFILFENNYHNDLSRIEAEKIINDFTTQCGYESVDLSTAGDMFIKPKK